MAFFIYTTGAYVRACAIHGVACTCVYCILYVVVRVRLRVYCILYVVVETTEPHVFTKTCVRVRYMELCASII